MKNPNITFGETIKLKASEQLRRIFENSEPDNITVSRDELKYISQQIEDLPLKNKQYKIYKERILNQLNSIIEGK